MSMPEGRCGTSARFWHLASGAIRCARRTCCCAGIGLVLAAASHAADLGRDLPHTLLGKPLAAPPDAPTIWPDGRGLPKGQGSVVDGERLYAERCQSCHGERGTGGSGGHLAGRSPLDGPDPDRTVGNYWPYATTVFDYIRRAMPPQAPWSLSADETYALTAYVLHVGGVLPADARLDQATLAKVVMPNRFGFIPIREP